MDSRPPLPDAPPERLPGWIRAADALTVAVAGAGLLVAGFGGFRLHVLGGRVSITSGGRILVAAIALLLIRHAIRRDQPLYLRAWRGVARWWAADGVRTVTPLWAASRLGVLLVGFLAVGTFGYRDGGAPFRLYENELLNLPARYDAGWYLGIATDGYKWDPAVTSHQNIAFMPALPMLMRFGGRLIGGHPLWAGQLLVLGACLWAFVYVFRLARSALGDADQAAWAVALLAAYPFAVFYGAVYTESIFLLCAAGAFYHVGRQQYLRTAAFALLCGFARPNGFLLAVPIALVALWPALVAAWRDAGSGHGAPLSRAIRASLPAIAAASAAVLGVLVFSAFIYSMTGRPFAWLEAHAAWGRTFGAWVSQGPFQELGRGGLYGYTRSQPIDAVNLVAVLFALAAIWPVTRRFGVPYGVFIAVNVIPPLTTGGLLSIGRVTAGMFPLFFWLAAVIPARHRAAWLTAFALLQGWGAALFYTWREFI
ncbi:MAG: hypothetical protein MUE61_03805 [Vicinamibacterales bacterium]|jgi:hypothetical protein|nr:hypothetical protein [Vicinamibacterales bacterium]